MSMTSLSSVHSSLPMYRTALAALQARISFIPILADGSKAPAVKWKEYQQRLPTLQEAREWFFDKHRDRGIAFITGGVSGGRIGEVGLEMLDFDSRSVYEQFARLMRQQGEALLLERIERGYKELSPQGVHLYYRCQVIEGNKKLAQLPLHEPPWVESKIETRGEGGYGIAAPSQGGVHPSRRPYQLVQGSLATIQTIVPEERAVLLAVARTLNAMPPPEKKAAGEAHQSHRTSHRQDGERLPGHLFNERATWSEILEAHGWTWVKRIGQEDFWRRPGKDVGISATTNFDNSDYLYVFSSSTPFEPRVGISKWAAYTILEHQGNFSASTKALVAQGYGKENHPRSLRGRDGNSQRFYKGTSVPGKEIYEAQNKTDDAPIGSNRRPLIKGGQAT